MYDLGNKVSIGGGGHYMWDSTPDNFYQVSAALRYGLSDDMYIQGSYSYTNYSWRPDTHGVGIMFVKSIGDGVTFGGRDYAGMWNRF